jgi:hypothetical protein
MKRYLIIESRDPFEAPSFAGRNELAANLAAGAEVTLFLVENAVLAARSRARFAGFARLKKAGVTLIADEFALRERGITVAELVPEVKAGRIDLLVAELGRGAKALWC